MTVTLHCKVCDITFEGELQPGTPYGQACKNGCGRYTQVVKPRVEPRKVTKRAKKAAVKRRRKTS